MEKIYAKHLRDMSRSNYLLNKNTLFFFFLLSFFQFSAL